MEQITEKEISDILNQLKNVVQDKDRVRLIKANSHSYSFSSEQVLRLVKNIHYGDAKIQTAILLYPNCIDKQNYQSVINEFYDEEKKEIKSKLGIN